jgi:hypothetical protein
MDAKPLRLMYKHRWVSTVNATVYQYTLPDPTHNYSFLPPRTDDVERHRVVVTTLSQSRDLVNCGLKLGTNQFSLLSFMGERIAVVGSSE